MSGQCKKIWLGFAYVMISLSLISCRHTSKELSDTEAKKAAVSELNKILD